MASAEDVLKALQQRVTELEGRHQQAYLDVSQVLTLHKELEKGTKDEFKTINDRLNTEISKLQSVVTLKADELKSLTEALRDEIPQVKSDIEGFHKWHTNAIPKLDAMADLVTKDLVTRKEFSNFGDAQQNQYAYQVQEAGQVRRLVQDIETRLSIVEQGSAQTGSTSGAQGMGVRPQHVSNSRSLNTVPLYTGRPKEYENWAQKMKNILFLADKRFRDLIKFLDGQETEFADVDFDTAMSGTSNSELEDMSEQLWFLISVKSGAELLPTMNKIEMDNSIDQRYKGPRLWWSIRAYAMGANLSRVQALNARVYGPERLKSEDNLQFELDCWEADVREYEVITKQKIGDMAQRGGLLQLIPKKLADAIEESALITTYTDARNYVQRQIDLKRAAWTRGGTERQLKGPSTSKDVTMGNFDRNLDEGDDYENTKPWDDVHGGDHPGEIYGFQGKGKGKFSGECDYCGRPNHRWRDCHKLANDRWRGQEQQWHNPGKGGVKGHENGKGKGYAGYYKGGYPMKGGGKAVDNAKGKGKDKGGYGKQSNFGKGGYASMVDDQYSTPLASVVEGEYKPVKRGVRITAAPPCRPPPGIPTRLSNSFDAIAPAEDEIDDQDIPPVDMVLLENWAPVHESVGTKNTRTRMPRVARWKAMTGTVNSLGQEKKPKSNHNCMHDLIPTLDPSILRNPAALKAQASEAMQFCSVVTAEELNYMVEDGPVACSFDPETEEMECLLDSGASTNVASPSVGKGIPVRESHGSRVGQVYYAANGTKLPNLGEKVMNIQTENWENFSLTMQLADVKKPLMSVSKICDAGSGENLVVFSARGGYIWHADKGVYTEFPREGGVYPMKTWIQKPATTAATGEPSPFARPGH